MNAEIKICTELEPFLEKTKYVCLNGEPIFNKENDFNLPVVTQEKPVSVSVDTRASITVVDTPNTESVTVFQATAEKVPLNSQENIRIAPVVNQEKPVSVSVDSRANTRSVQVDINMNSDSTSIVDKITFSVHENSTYTHPDNRENSSLSMNRNKNISKVLSNFDAAFTLPVQYLPKKKKNEGGCFWQT